MFPDVLYGLKLRDVHGQFVEVLERQITIASAATADELQIPLAADRLFVPAVFIAAGVPGAANSVLRANFSWVDAVTNTYHRIAYKIFPNVVNTEQECAFYFPEHTIVRVNSPGSFLSLQLGYTGFVAHSTTLTLRGYTMPVANVGRA